MGSSVPQFTFGSNNHSNNMAYNQHSSYTNGSSSTQRSYMDGPADEQQAPPLTSDPNFDILEWHPAYQSCQRYFLDHAQHEPGTQALCALINIRLPFQWPANPIMSSNQPAAGQGSSNSSYNFNFPRPGTNNIHSPGRSRTSNNQSAPVFVSLIPYIRRLVITGFDKTPILHGFFGDDYARGALPHLECERRNYLFAAKHGGWRSCKKQYDNGSGCGGDECVPFMKPLDEAKMEELTAAEKAWSGWLAMEDWMVGPRAPDETGAGSSQQNQQGDHQRHGVGGETGLLPDGLDEGFDRR